MKHAAVLLLLTLTSSLAQAQALPQPIPSLDEGGLVALIALIGVVAGIAARRRKK